MLMIMQVDGSGLDMWNVKMMWIGSM